MPKINRKILVTLIINLLVFCCLIYWGLKHVDFHGCLIEFKKSGTLLIFLLTITTNLFLLLLYTKRIKFLLPQLSTRHALWLTSTIHLANSLLPLRLGEFLRLWICKKIFNITLTTALTTLMLERIIDIIAIICLAFLSVTCVNDYIYKLLLNKISVISIIICVLFAVLSYILLNPLFIKKLQLFKQNLQIIIKKENKINFIKYTIYIWLFTIMSFYMFFKLQNIQYFRPIDAINIVIISSLAIASPNLSASIGSFEAGIIFYLNQQFNISTEQGLAFAVILHLGTIIAQFIFTILGFNKIQLLNNFSRTRIQHG